MAEQEFNFPIGTVAEVQELGLDVSQIPTCAKALDNRIKGCPYWDTCRFRNIRDANGGMGAGPENFGYTKVLNARKTNQVSNGIIQSCFTIMAVESELMSQTRHTGNAYSRFKPPGETVVIKRRRRLHSERSKDCPGCNSKEGCVLFYDEKDPVVVPKFLRPRERFGDAVFNQEINDEIMDEIDFEGRLGGIMQNPPNPRTVADIPQEAGGTGRGQTLQEQVKKAR